MDTLTEDWEILAKRTNSKFLFSLLMLAAIHCSSKHHPIRASHGKSAKSTGLIRRVTANSASEAAEKVRQGFFDSPRARRWHD
jgi:hypothetical protein